MYPIEIDNMLSTFNLREKRDTISESLTAGMKRKLSVMIALIGDSKVLEKRERQERGGGREEGAWTCTHTKNAFLPAGPENSWQQYESRYES